ncbi:MAG TPA: DNA-binding protein [Treponema sp.]|nr:MAG: hypothetical protein A2001_04460 [Treponema sp. GWC1_61_84]OHE68014.1 MAG: hypothetical protein A2413_10000 [Treponema sp. RIFOXYC1_FULL_61_9]HCM27614.1 DNA-binding protein [Treponema sp.]
MSIRVSPATASILIFALSILPVRAFSEPLPISSAEAVEKAKELDGRVVEFVGEAIGEALRRGDHAWLNLGDGNAALGVWMLAADIPAGLSFGSYERTGDRVRVRGDFRRACPEHGGDMDIHAHEAVIIEKGNVTDHPVDPSRLIAALFFLALSAGLLYIWIRIERSAKDRRSSSAHDRIDRGKEAGR